MRPKQAIVIMVVVGLLAGCGLRYRPATPVMGNYYLNPQRNISSVSKAVVVELENFSSQPEAARRFTDALCEALGKRGLFGLEVIYRSDELYRSLQLDSAEWWDLEKLAAIRQATGADAVVTGAVTEYRPYPHTAAGLKVRLVDLRNGELLWAIQQVWDSSDRAVEQRMRYFFQSQMRDDYEPLNWRLAVMSERHFRKFVAYETARTLP